MSKKSSTFAPQMKKNKKIYISPRTEVNLVKFEIPMLIDGSYHGSSGAPKLQAPVF